MNSGANSLRNSGNETYEATLGYLEYDDTSDRLSIPMRIRERHLTPDTTLVYTQAIGPELQITIFSERDDILIRFPLRHWRTSDSYEGTLSGPNNGLLSIGRFEDYIEAVEYPEDGKKGIAVEVTPVDIEIP